MFVSFSTVDKKVNNAKSFMEFIGLTDKLIIRKYLRLVLAFNTIFSESLWGQH